MSWKIKTTTIYEFPQEEKFTKCEAENMFDYALQELCEHQRCYDDEAYQSFISFNISVKHLTDLQKELSDKKSESMVIEIKDLYKYTNLNSTFEDSDSTTLTIKY